MPAASTANGQCSSPDGGSGANGAGGAASPTTTAPSVMTASREKKRRGLLGIKSPFKFMGGGGGSSKIFCAGCKKKCSGEVLRVGGNERPLYFHGGCFLCRGCRRPLAQGGFFARRGGAGGVDSEEHYCASCYQSQFGTKCAACRQFVEGEVVTALGKTYHQTCFKCEGCFKPFPMGERVTFTGKRCLCQVCIKKDTSERQAEKKSMASPQKKQEQQYQGHSNSNHESISPSKTKAASSPRRPAADDLCAGCNEELRDGQALMALDKQYHIWCFKCRACDSLLHGEYMGKDGYPYCEKDYQQQFGVKCTYCRRFISGKVLQAGDNNHFHPTCARCTKCGDPFGDGEEMFLQGAAIWHPRCGPGPDDSLGGLVVNGFENGSNYAHHQRPPSALAAGDHGERASMASVPFYGSRASSPGASLRRGDPYYNSGRFSRSTVQVPGWSYSRGGHGLYSSSSTYSLRRPIEPGDRGSTSNLNHFHLPPSRRTSAASHSYQAYHTAPSRTSMDAPLGANRPISCPPKPGYTLARSCGVGYGSAISPGPGMHFNDFNTSVNDDVASQQSFRTDHSEYLMRPSQTYTQGFTRTYFPLRPQTPGPFTGEHKIYPLHTLFTNNYKMPPDIDRCNLEKHLSDTDFQLAFGMERDEFYSLPMWKRNNLKRRVKLF